VTDRDAIVETQIRYADACDSRDLGSLAEVFTADAVGDYGPRRPQGRQEIVGMIEGFLGGCGPTQHLLGNHVVAVDGDRATARCAIRAFHAGRPGSAAEGATYTVYGTYHDELVRTPEGWRIASRRMEVVHQAGDHRVFGG
jgi:ketosteroid isomerase-like protein